MKVQRIYIFLAATMIVVAGTSCKKSFFSDQNINPNAVDAVPPYLLLPSVEGALAFDQGGDFSRNAALIDQQVFGLQNQTQTFYQYGINAGTLENQWTDMYTSAMENTKQLIRISDNLQQNTYSGIARILMAYELQVMVDTWGDIPYSQAFGGNLSEADGGTIQPKYDAAQALYDTIGLLIDSAIARFALDPGVGTPTTDDVMYGGDTGLWTKFGHAIKARLYIHQSKDDAAMATSALAEVAESFESEAESAQYKFLGDGNTTNPWVQFQGDRAAYISFALSPFADSLTASNDPRYDKLIDTSGGGDELAEFYGSSNSPTEYITYEELQFIKAEATLRSGGSMVDAQTAYVAGITANMDKLGVASADQTTYLAANGVLPTGMDAAVAKVAKEEYAALYLNPEAWTVYRRTGSPALAPTGPGSVPRRFIYPQSEYSYNSANVPASTLATPKIFWDK